MGEKQSLIGNFSCLLKEKRWAIPSLFLLNVNRKTLMEVIPAEYFYLQVMQKTDIQR
jgi:hypothetical protein